jgi:hypothetical protein
MLTLPMENLDIVMCLRRVSQGLVKVPPVVRDRRVNCGGRASPTQGRGTDQGGSDVGTGIVRGDAASTERTHRLLSGTFLAGVVGGGFLGPHTVQSGVVEDRLFAAGDGRRFPGGRQEHLSIGGEVTHVAHFLLVEDLSEGDRAAEGLRVDVTIPGVDTADTGRAGTFLAGSDTSRPDCRVAGQGDDTRWASVGDWG